MAIMMVVTFLPASVSAAADHIEKTSRLPYGYDFTGAYTNVPAKYKGHCMTANEVERWTFVSADGKRYPAYCIEFRNPNFTPGGTVSSSTNFTKLSYTQQLYATYALMYGYDGTTKWGYSADAEYYATQVMMWAIADNVFNNSTYESDFVNGFSTDWITGTYHREIRDLYFKIKSEILNHNKVPSFAKTNSVTASTVTLNYNASTGYYETTLTDTNNILASFTFEFGSDVKVTRSGNTLKLQTKTVIPNARTVSTYKSATLQNPNAKIVWWELLEDKCGADQVKVHGESPTDPVRAYVKIKTNSLSKAHIVKTSDDGNVSGIKIRISNSALGYNKTFVTNSKGEINATDLIDGYKYTATEMDVPSQYIQPQSQTFTASITKTVELKFHNTLKKGWAQIRKEDSETGKQIPGAVYGFFDSQGNLLEKLTTQQNDYSKTSKMYVAGKTYYFQELTAPDGYVINPTKYPVTITEDGQTISITANDNAQKFTFTLTKTDSGTEKAVPGAEYKLWFENDVVTADGTLRYKSGETVDTLSTGEDGSDTSVELYIGKEPVTLCYQETVSPPGYVLDSEIHKVTVSPGESHISVKQYADSVTDDSQKFTFTLTKTDSGTEKAVPGAEYKLWFENDVVTADGTLRYKAGETVDTLSTGEDGSDTSVELYIGKEPVTLCYQETVSPPGYVLDPEIHKITVSPGESHISVKQYADSVTDDSQKFTFTLTKTDSGTEKAVPGAEYKLWFENDVVTADGTLRYKAGETVDTLSTGEDGSDTSVELYIGKEPVTLCYQETVSPPGYVLDPEIHKITVSPGDSTISVVLLADEVTDDAQQFTFTLRKTDSVTAKPLQNAKYQYWFKSDVVSADGTVRYKAGEIIGTLITDKDGTSTTPVLFVGKEPVTLCYQEIECPPGYVLDTSVHEIEVSPGESHISVVLFADSVTNDAQLVQIEILKQGEVLSNFDFRMTEFGKVYAPIYEIRNLGGATFEMVALTDIVSPDGTLWYHKGDIIDTQATQEDGSPAVFKPLRSLSGKVLVREKNAPYGYFLGSNEFEVELGYDSPEVQQFTVNLDAENSRQKYKLRFAKTIEENEVYPNPEAYQDIIFGVKTKAPVLNADGVEVLGADELVDVIGLDSSFNGISNTDYWEGADLYLQELQTAEGYNLNPEKYGFGFEYTEQTIPLVWKDLNETYNEILNTVIRGQVELYKRSSFDGRLLPNAHYDIYDLNGNYIETLVTDKKGHAISSMLPYGDYILKEMIAPDRYHLEPTEYPFSINEQGQVITFDMEDEPKIGMITADYTEQGHDEAIGIPTGDPSHLALTVSLSLLSLSGIGILLFKRRSRK